jgi:hypothetical protein
MYYLFMLSAHYLYIYRTNTTFSRLALYQEVNESCLVFNMIELRCQLSAVTMQSYR